MPKSLAILWPPDRYDRNRLAAGRRPIPITTIRVATITVGDEVFIVCFHCRHCRSGYFLVPTSLLRRDRPPKQLAPTKIFLLRPALTSFVAVITNDDSYFPNGGSVSFYPFFGLSPTKHCRSSPQMAFPSRGQYFDTTSNSHYIRDRHQ